MLELLLASSRQKELISLVRRSGLGAEARFLEFFAANIRNPNTRIAYYRAVAAFLNWADRAGLSDLTSIGPIHVAAWVEELGFRYSVPSVKQQLAALKMLFDWLVMGQVIPTNPAASVKSPRHIIRKGKTAVLDPSEARQLIESISPANVIGLRDRALIGTMLYTFARIGAALAMVVDDVYFQHRRLWVRLHEKGGKLHDMPCHHELEAWLVTYIEAANLRSQPDRALFRSWNRQSSALGNDRLCHSNAYAMVQRRAKQAGIKTAICNHTFRATGITAYLLNNGTLEKAAKMANHASTRTTQLYDRRDDSIVLSEVERIRFE
ncbi:tyrosine-type recombinase/integrase [Mesorhizobium silamurunense]|uniref:tyrosine-type recombinase/integrase n=1 Tax=Mesorhizobium silamurunense TaxID=499528 RepID=UPI001786A120|nr:tyrosine-type recombinase/integrase [Mesorhizobium silamurunense]